MQTISRLSTPVRWNQPAIHAQPNPNQQAFKHQPQFGMQPNHPALPATHPAQSLAQTIIHFFQRLFGGQAPPPSQPQQQASPPRQPASPPQPLQTSASIPIQRKDAIKVRLPGNRNLVTLEAEGGFNERSKEITLKHVAPPMNDLELGTAKLKHRFQVQENGNTPKVFYTLQLKDINSFAAGGLGLKPNEVRAKLIELAMDAAEDYNDRGVGLLVKPQRNPEVSALYKKQGFKPVEEVLPEVVAAGYPQYLAYDPTSAMFWERQHQKEEERFSPGSPPEERRQQKKRLDKYGK